jgi:hypothetical protein
MASHRYLYPDKRKRARILWIRGPGASYRWLSDAAPGASKGLSGVILGCISRKRLIETKRAKCMAMRVNA